jgi:hypothetical protein
MTASVLTGTVIVRAVRELDSGGPGAPPPFDATLVKAFDRNIQRVDDSCERPLSRMPAASVSRF